MELSITKNKDKPHIISYKRDDGSETWMKSDDFFVVHDLSHFALEKTLHFTTAFMGMLNNGMDVKDFESREKRMQIQVSDEAVYAENMANLFLMETTQGQLEDFKETVKQSFKKMNKAVNPPVLNDEEISAVRVYLKELISEWRLLPFGKTMTLIYNFNK